MQRLQASPIDLRSSYSISCNGSKIYYRFKRLKHSIGELFSHQPSKEACRLLAVFGVSGTAMLHERETHPHPKGRDAVM